MKILIPAAGAGLLFAAALTMASAEAAVETPCNQRDSVIGHLAQKYQEVPVAIGVTNRGGLVEVLSTGDGKTWTIIVSTPDGTSCLIAAGEGWRSVPKAAPTGDPKA